MDGHFFRLFHMFIQHEWAMSSPERVVLQTRACLRLYEGQAFLDVSAHVTVSQLYQFILFPLPTLLYYSGKIKISFLWSTHLSLSLLSKHLTTLTLHVREATDCKDRLLGQMPAWHLNRKLRSPESPWVSNWMCTEDHGDPANSTSFLSSLTIIQTEPLQILKTPPTASPSSALPCLCSLVQSSTQNLHYRHPWESFPMLYSTCQSLAYQSISWASGSFNLSLPRVAHWN